MSESIGSEQRIITELEAGGVATKRRRALLVELRQVGTEKSIDVLRANLRCTDVKSQVRAVFALAHIGTKDAIDALIDALAETTGPCFGFSIKSLVDADTERALPALVRTLERRDDLRQGEKRMLIYAMYQTPHRSEVPVLATMLGERSRSTRRMAAAALAQIRASESRQALEEAVESLSWWRGLQARRSLRLLRATEE